MDQEASTSGSQNVDVKQEPMVEQAAGIDQGSMNKSKIYVDVSDNEYPEGEVYVYEGTDDDVVTEKYSALLEALSYQFKRLRLLKIVYQTPGPNAIELKDMEQVRQYLRSHQFPELNVENFSFESSIDCMKKWHIYEKCPMEIGDLSNGIEALPVTVVNQYDAEKPDPFTYTIDRMPMAGVEMKLDPDFLCGCDCRDDCFDKSKCACCKLTIEGAKHLNPKIKVDKVGYVYKRLYDPVPTGIYECNSRCKCNQKCLNRVVQKPYQLQWELQLYRTTNRGWGARTLCDIPKGSFICCYTGQLLTGSNDYLDYTYQADLNHIEAVEEMKEGYEPGVVDDQPSSSSAVAGQAEAGRKSIQKFYGPNEAFYVMDAKKEGSISRFFNHSCDPNLFVQNLFIDTHDLRYPWVAFFASKNIKAGTELTWDYGYEKGSVPGTSLICQCGTKKCRKRLL